VLLITPNAVPLTTAIRFGCPRLRRLNRLNASIWSCRRVDPAKLQTETVDANLRNSDRLDHPDLNPVIGRIQGGVRRNGDVHAVEAEASTDRCCGARRRFPDRCRPARWPNR